MRKKKTLIIGIGNALRTDDGVAAYICNELEDRKLPGVHILITQQLDIGITEELSSYPRVVFVDASPDETSCTFEPLLSTEMHSRNVSHQIEAALLADLTRRLFNPAPEFYICAVGVSDFRMGNLLSGKALENAKVAITLLTAWISETD